MSREDQYSVGVVIDNVSYGVFDKLEGGEVTAEDLKYRPGGLAPAVSLGGGKTTGNITLSRLYDAVRDHQKMPTLFDKVGKGQVVAMKQLLDVDGNAFGRPITYRGTLTRATPPNADSESNNAGMLELEISVTGQPS